MPLEEATTPSLEALQAYSAGFKAALAGSKRACRCFNVRSRSIPILRWPMRSRVPLQRDGGVGARATELTQGLPAAQSGQRRRALLIDTLCDRDFTGNLERERRTLETWAESYPRDARHTLIAGLALMSTGQHELAIAETEKAIALDPDSTRQQGIQSAPAESP